MANRLVVGPSADRFEHLEAQAQRRDELAAHALRTDLARSLGLYETALDVTPNLVIGIDGRGSIRLFNRDAEAVTGYAVEDVIGAAFVDTLVPPGEHSGKGFLDPAYPITGRPR